MIYIFKVLNRHPRLNKIVLFNTYSIMMPSVSSFLNLILETAFIAIQKSPIKTWDSVNTKSKHNIQLAMNKHKNAYNKRTYKSKLVTGTYGYIEAD